MPSPEDLPDPGIEFGSPALQADSLPSEPPEQPSGRRGDGKTSLGSNTTDSFPKFSKNTLNKCLIAAWPLEHFQTLIKKKKCYQFRWGMGPELTPSMLSLSVQIPKLYKVLQDPVPTHMYLTL